MSHDWFKKLNVLQVIKVMTLATAMPCTICILEGLYKTCLPADRLPTAGTPTSTTVMLMTVYTL